MSHFGVLVVTDRRPSQEDLERILAPWHEFECTGVDNEYIQNIDETEKARAKYESSLESRLRAPDGTLHNPYDPEFYRDFTQEEINKHGKLIGSGGGGGISWTSMDWGDDKGYRAKIRFVPDGWKEIQVSSQLHRSFAEWAHSCYGTPLIRPGDIADSRANEMLKWGWIQVDENENVIQIIKRTNPNAQWDWWAVGGRFSGFFHPTLDSLYYKGKPGLAGSEISRNGADIIRKCDVNFAAMRRKARNEAEKEWDRVREIVGDISEFVTFSKMLEKHSDNESYARADYFDQLPCRKLSEACKVDTDLYSVELEEFLVSREEFVNSRVARSTVFFAYVKDGKWHQRGETLWWGAVAEEKTRDDWTKSFNDMLDSLPDSAWLTVVDCHI